MIETIKVWRDKLLGRGDAAITIPVLDGALKPNQMLEEAEVFAKLDAPEDLATDGKSLFVANGTKVLRFDNGQPVEVASFNQTVTALACLEDGGLAVALGGREVRIVGGRYDGRRWDKVNNKPMNSVNAICGTKDGRLILTDGSTTQPYERWSHDLMELGRTGRLLEIDLKQSIAKEIDSGLHYAFGCCVAGNSVWVAESWKHRLLRYNGNKIDTNNPDNIVIDWFPGYPCRITAASDGGYWLAAFAGRTQLVEFVLREHPYRKRMIKEVDPRYWIAPALSSGDDFLEPLQGAHVKMRGVIKAYAPPRSYGLVTKLSATGQPQYSFHSRLDGKNHGVVAVAECNGTLYVLAKGNGRILQLPIADAERRLRA